MVIDTYASLPLEEKEHLVEEIFSDVSLFNSPEVPKQFTALESFLSYMAHWRYLKFRN